MTDVCWLSSSGVFQSLVEKHFPAPDRRKMFDLLTMGSSSSSLRFDDSPVPSPSAVTSVKRKLDSSGMLFLLFISTNCYKNSNSLMLIVIIIMMMVLVNKGTRQCYTVSLL